MNMDIAMDIDTGRTSLLLCVLVPDTESIIMYTQTIPMSSRFTPMRMLARSPMNPSLTILPAEDRRNVPTIRKTIAGGMCRNSLSEKMVPMRMTITGTVRISSPP